MRTVTVALLVFIFAALSSRGLALQDNLSRPHQTPSQVPEPGTPTAEFTGITMPPMKGMTVNAWSAEAYNSTDFDESIADLVDLQANWVTFTVFWFMNTSSGTTIQPRLDLYTASDASLEYAIQTAHELGMQVALKPMVDVVDGSWRGTIAPASWSAWFVSYRDFINHCAELGEANNIELFEVGTELRSSQSAESEWRQVITEARARFSGNLTYAANWDSYSTYARLPQYAVQFWDALDYVGVDAYFPLTNSYSPTVTQLISAWTYSTASGWWGTGRNWTSELYSTHTQTGKNIIFTEIGYYSQDGTNTQPWTGFSPPHTLDLQEQADCYHAAIEAFRNETWFSGWFWWDWDTNPDAGGPTDNWYTPQNKPAQTVLNQYYDNETPPDLAVLDVTTSKTVVGNGYPVTINVTVANQGMYPETFNLTTHINATLLQRITLILESGTSTVNAIIWDTTGFASGNYTIHSHINPLPTEIDTLDNAKNASHHVCVTLPGDVDADHDVDIFDIVRVAGIYGVNASDPLYQPNYDIDGDGDVDIFDVVIAAGNYGESEP